MFWGFAQTHIMYKYNVYIAEIDLIASVMQAETEMLFLCLYVVVLVSNLSLITMIVDICRDFADCGLSIILSFMVTKSWISYHAKPEKSGRYNISELNEICNRIVLQIQHCLQYILDLRCTVIFKVEFYLYIKYYGQFRVLSITTYAK